MDIDTALLRTMIAVADTGHVGHAAGRLGVSQQAVSQRLAKLKAQLGVPVFERTGRGIQITVSGSVLLPHCRQIVEELDLLASKARPETRPLLIDVLDDQLAILRYVIEYADESGDPIEVVTRSDSASVTDWLRSGRADLSLGRAGPLGSPWPADLARGAPMLEPIGLLVGSQHPWYERTTIRSTALAEYPLWFPGTGAPDEWRALLTELSIDLDVPIDQSGSTRGADQFLTDLAGSSDTVSLWGTAMRMPPPGMRVVPIIDPVPVFPWFPVWRRGQDRVVRDLAAAIIGRARRAVAEPHPSEAWLPASDRALLSPGAQLDFP